MHINHRSKGYGAATTAKLVEQAGVKGIDKVYIGTETGTSAESFYKNIGCTEAFRAKAYDLDLSKFKSGILERVKSRIF